MLNLLHTPISRTELAAILDKNRSTALLPALGPAQWQAAFTKPAIQEALERLRPTAEAERDQPLPALSDELYANFHQTGLRRPFESLYHERRRRLARSVLFALQAGSPDSLWMKSTVAKLYDIFAETSWTYPAHTREPSGKEPMHIDLFAAETANLMGEMLTMFHQVLPEDFQQQVKERLRREYFQNYLDRDFHWQKLAMNWNAVCHQGVLGAALMVEEDCDLVAAMLLKAAQHLPVFLSGFTADGGSSEGPAYWVYGFGWFCELNRQLEDRTGGEFSYFEGDEHVRAIAGFGPRMAFSNGKFVNFSDAGPDGILRPPLLAYLADRLQEPACRSAVNAAYRQQISTLSPDLPRLDVFFLTQFVLRCPDPLAQEPKTAPSSSAFLNLGVVVSQSYDAAGNLWEFAAKSGHNEEFHNHNDCGSYLLNLNGQRIVAEIGAPEYVRDFFGPKRYDFLAARSLGHSVALINGVEQGTGREFAGQIIEADNSESHLRFLLDLTAAYPTEAGCKHYLRTIVFDKGAGFLQINDDFTLLQCMQLETALITTAQVTTLDHETRLHTNDVHISVVAEPGTVLKNIERHEYRTHLGEDAWVNRIVFTSAHLAQKTSIKYTIALADVQ